VTDRSSSYDPDTHGPRVLGPGFHQRVHGVVRTVPAGRVTTFGDIAAALGWRRAARRVGQALARLPGETTDVPWQRVIRASGEVACGEKQATRLRSEGVSVDRTGRVVDFQRLRWNPEPQTHPRSQAQSGPGR
jgi:methylated-DNA-protein-cysteine methyltransferase-like protein